LFYNPLLFVTAENGRANAIFALTQNIYNNQLNTETQLKS